MADTGPHQTGRLRKPPLGAGLNVSPIAARLDHTGEEEHLEAVRSQPATGRSDRPAIGCWPLRAVVPERHPSREAAGSEKWPLTAICEAEATGPLLTFRFVASAATVASVWKHDELAAVRSAASSPAQNSPYGGGRPLFSVSRRPAVPGGSFGNMDQDGRTTEWASPQVDGVPAPSAGWVLRSSLWVGALLVVGLPLLVR